MIKIIFKSFLNQKNVYHLDELINSLKIICSIRILNEGIDIPNCDSVFIGNVGTYSSDITMVQRMCRANRLLKRNPNKVAYCFLWTDDLNKIVNSSEFYSNELLKKNMNISREMIEDNKEKLTLLNNELISCKKGLDNIRNTYIDDEQFISAIDIIKTSIEIRLKKNLKYCKTK